MRWIRTVAAEIYYLFVDDGSFAAAILIWVIAVGLILPRLSLPADAKGPVLALGLAVILVGGAARRARR